MTMPDVDTTPIPSPGPAPAPGADAWFNLALSVGDLTNQIKADRQQRANCLPLRAPRTNSGTVGADGTLRLSLGSPAMGRRWDLRSLAVSDAVSVTATVAGRADIYVGNPSALAPADWRASFSTLSAVDTWGADRIKVIPHDHLVVMVTGATAGQSITATAEVDDYAALSHVQEHRV